MKRVKRKEKEKWGRGKIGAKIRSLIRVRKFEGWTGSSSFQIGFETVNLLKYKYIDRVQGVDISFLKPETPFNGISMRDLYTKTNSIPYTLFYSLIPFSFNLYNLHDYTDEKVCPTDMFCIFRP